MTESETIDPEDRLASLGYRGTGSVDIQRRPKTPTSGKMWLGINREADTVRGERFGSDPFDDWNQYHSLPGRVHRMEQQTAQLAGILNELELARHELGYSSVSELIREIHQQQRDKDSAEIDTNAAESTSTQSSNNSSPASESHKSPHFGLNMKPFHFALAQGGFLILGLAALWYSISSPGTALGRASGVLPIIFFGLVLAGMMAEKMSRQIDSK